MRSFPVLKVALQTCSEKSYSKKKSWNSQVNICVGVLFVQKWHLLVSTSEFLDFSFFGTNNEFYEQFSQKNNRKMLHSNFFLPIEPLRQNVS